MSKASERYRFFLTQWVDINISWFSVISSSTHRIGNFYFKTPHLWQQQQRWNQLWTCSRNRGTTSINPFDWIFITWPFSVSIYTKRIPPLPLCRLHCKILARITGNRRVARWKPHLHTRKWHKEKWKSITQLYKNPYSYTAWPECAQVFDLWHSHQFTPIKKIVFAINAV